jgi:glycosyltransferase involved in cell wall biosynthesis
LIVIDNASTDDTDAVVAEFAHDDRLRYIKNAVNIGLTPNHNRGLAHARGIYVLFVSADDMLLPGHLRRCYDYLQANPATDVLYTGVLLIDAAGEPIAIRAMGGQLPVDYDGGRNEFAQQLSEGCYIPLTSMLIRRSLYDELGPMDEDFVAADYEITTRWAAAGKRFAYLRVPSCAIRLHGPQASGANYVSSGEDLREYIAILEKHVVPANYPLLHGYQRHIAAHLRWRVDFFRQTANRDLEPHFAARAAAMADAIERVPDMPFRDGLGDRPLITVVVRPGSVRQLAHSLQSLAAQVDAPPWEAVIVGEGGPDYQPYLRTLSMADRLRFVRMDDVNPGAARHLGYRLAAGRIITYLDPGSSYELAHLANVARAFDTGAFVVRTDATLVVADSHDGTPNTIFQEFSINGVYRAAQDDDRDLVAPAIPLDTVAHLRSLVASVGAIRSDLPYGETWEFWLRLRQFGVRFVPDPTARVHVLRSTAVPASEAFFNVVNAIYTGYPVDPASPVGQRRAAFVAALQGWFRNVPLIMDDRHAAIAFLAEIHGVERSAALAPS